MLLVTVGGSNDDDDDDKLNSNARTLDARPCRRAAIGPRGDRPSGQAGGLSGAKVHRRRLKAEAACALAVGGGWPGSCFAIAERPIYRWKSRSEGEAQ